MKLSAIGSFVGAEASLFARSKLGTEPTRLSSGLIWWLSPGGPKPPLEASLGEDQVAAGAVTSGPAPPGVIAECSASSAGCI